MARRWFGGGGHRWPFPSGGTAPDRSAGLGFAAPGRRLWSPSRGRGAAPHKPTLASSLVAALLAVGVVLGFVVARTSGPSIPSNGSQPTTSVPRVTVPVVSPPVYPAATTSTTSPHTVVSAPSQASGPAPCTPADVSVTTATDASSYPSGGTVTVTTLLRAVRACVFQPVASGPYGCADTVIVVDGSNHQAWPWPGESEQCSPPAATVLQPGVTETLRAAWDGDVYSNGRFVPAPPGTYQAIGTWYWSAGAGQGTSRATVASAPFAVS